MTQTQFNENEVNVLNALANEMTYLTGGQFGNMNNVNRGNLTTHQFAGYISDLNKKGTFKYISTTTDYRGQFALTEDIYNQFK